MIANEEKKLNIAEKVEEKIKNTVAGMEKRKRVDDVLEYIHRTYSQEELESIIAAATKKIEHVNVINMIIRGVYGSQDNFDELKDAVGGVPASFKAIRLLANFCEDEGEVRDFIFWVDTCPILYKFRKACDANKTKRRDTVNENGMSIPKVNFKAPVVNITSIVNNEIEERLELPTRTLNALKNSYITTIQQLSSLNDDQLLRIDGLGRKGIYEIREQLKKVL